MPLCTTLIFIFIFNCIFLRSQFVSILLCCLICLSFSITQIKNDWRKLWFMLEFISLVFQIENRLNWVVTNYLVKHINKSILSLLSFSWSAHVMTDYCTMPSIKHITFINLTRLIYLETLLYWRSYTQN